MSGRRYKTPHCVAELDSGRLCGHEMRVMGERHPQAGPGIHVFQCGYCGAVQAMDEDKLDRYVLRA